VARRSSTANRYAEAVFQVARDSNSFDLWLRELGEVNHVLADPQAARVLFTPVLPRERKAAILRETLPDLSEAVWRFLDFLLKRDRLSLLPRIGEALHELIDAQRGVERARVTTAVPLGAAEREQVKARLAAWSGRQIELDEQVDPSIIGGVVAQVGDEILDGSVRGRLERLRRTLAGT
jgi:F-type H+-transporting ATPase subunit delta